ncbi:MAG: acyl-CoA thioesterase [Muribaculaceae bacterium]|nr:acyl-CoA thioesterase [Muribaculaceae bacterium]
MKQEIPQLPFDFRHRLPLQIRFNDVDMFGHVNNAVYVQFMDMGKLAYFKQFMAGGFEKEEAVPVVADIHCTYYAPTLIDERIEVLTALETIGSSSFVLQQRIVAADGSVKCTARTVMVNIDTRTGAPTPVSDRWRTALSQYEGRDL